MKLREKEEGESQLLKSFSPAKGGFGGRHQKSPSLWNEKEEASIPRIRLNNIFLLPPPAGLLRGCVYACCIRSFEVPKPKKQLFPNKLPLLSLSLGFGGKTSNRASDAFIGLCSLLPSKAKLLLLGCTCVGKTRTCVASLSHRRRGHS